MPSSSPGLEDFSVPEGTAPESLDANSLLPDSPPAFESHSIEALEPAEPGKYPDVEKRFKTAIGEFKARRFSAAVDDAIGVIALFPEKPWDGRAAFLAARAMGELKNYDACATLFEAAREHLPIIGDYSLYLLAGYYFSGGKKQEAADTYRKLASTYPESPLANEALLKCSEALTDIGQYPEAIKILKGLLGNGNSQNVPETRLAYINACISTGDLNTASSQYRDLRLEYPWAEETSKAEELTRKAGIGPPELTPGELIRIGDLMSGRGMDLQAVEAYKEALRKGEGSADIRSKVLHRFGKAYYRLRKNGEAENALIEALSLASTKEEAAELYFTLEKLYLRTGDTGKFRDAALWCAALCPGEPRGVDALYMLGVTLSQNGEYDAAAGIFGWILAESPKTQRADEVIWQEGWACFRKGDYANADAAFGRLASGYPHSTLAPQALYWKAKALEASGQPQKALETRDALRRSYGWSFYGLLSEEPDTWGVASISEVGPAPAGSGISVTGSYRDRRLARAYELGLQEMRTSASKELKKAEKDYARDLEKLKEIMGLYISIGDVRRPFDIASNLYRTGLEVGSTKLSEEALRLLFPLGYWEAVLKGSNRFGVDPLLVSSVIRQESSFNEGAVSPAGAAGLMQLMPSTAKTVCRRLSMRFQQQRLFDCDFNVPVGASYLQSLIAKHNGRLVHALAEYNAGPANVERWINEMPNAPDDVFIEGIDFKETRGYVKKVLRNYMAYRKLYAPKKSEGVSSASAH